MHTKDNNDAPSGEMSPEEAAFREIEAREGTKTRWFAYIAVGITLVSLLLALATIWAAAYWLFHLMR